MVDKNQSVGAAFRVTKDGFAFTIDGVDVSASSEAIQERRVRREQSTSVSEILHDLLADSLEPLTKPLRRTTTDLTDDAVTFMSAFDGNAEWSLRLPPPGILMAGVGRAIQNQTTAHNASFQVGYRFVRFRFPFIRFEWRVETPNFVIRDFRPGLDNVVESRWTARRAGAGTNIDSVAYGHLKDTITVLAQGGQGQPERSFLIKRREFVVENVLQPELMKPKPLLVMQHLYEEGDIITALSTRQSIIQGIRSSQKYLAFLIALSALLNALRPLLDIASSSVGGWILTGIAIGTAFASIFSMLLGWLLIKLEARAAQFVISTV